MLKQLEMDKVSMRYNPILTDVSSHAVQSRCNGDVKHEHICIRKKKKGKRKKKKKKKAQQVKFTTD